MRLTRITDHAVLRAMERVHGFDVEGLRARMQAEVARAIAAAAAAGLPGRFALRTAGATYVIEGFTVVTVFEADHEVAHRWLRGGK